MVSTMLFRIICALCVINSAWTFYLPGLAPVNFCKAGKTTETCNVSMSYSYQS